MFKVLTGSAEVGGSLSLQKDTLNRAATDLESKLNSGNVGKVLAGGAYESSHEIILFAIVEAVEKKKKKKTGKGE